MQLICKVHDKIKIKKRIMLLMMKQGKGGGEKNTDFD